MPTRIQLSRKAGFNLQAVSLALNGLPAKSVARPGIWGNPYVPGKPAPIGPTKGAIVADKRHAFVLYRSMAPLNAELVARARNELRGLNLACWCGKTNPYEDECHAVVLLILANPAKAS